METVHGMFLGLTAIELGFGVGALVMTVLVGFVLIPVLRKALGEGKEAQ